MRRNQHPIMPHRRIITRAIFCIALTVLAACGGGDSDDDAATRTPAEDAATSTPMAAQEPVGIIALGHSALTGYRSDPAAPETDVPANSWATGDSPEVNSIYRRLVAVQPETEGHVFNAARDGALSAELADQAEAALAEVPAPAIVLIEIIGNDIRCDGTDAEYVDEFGANIAEALRVIAETSPRSRILIVGLSGRAEPEGVAAIIAIRPDLKAMVTGDGICDWYGIDGELAMESFANYSSIIDSYEAEASRVCAEVPQCETDGGRAKSFEDDPLGDYADDFIHLDVGGLARFAEHMWPAVESALAAP